MHPADTLLLAVLAGAVFPLAARSIDRALADAASFRRTVLTGLALILMLVAWLAARQL